MAILDDSYTLNEPYFNGRSYLEWLESFTIDERIDEHDRKTYHNLIGLLWDIEFEPSVGNDHDRAEEGLELRVRYNDIFSKKSGVGEFNTPDIRAIFGECRVLEMLIALSMRMYDLMQDMGMYNSVSRWFWEIMQNVGFDVLDDSEFEGKSETQCRRNGDFVRGICQNIMFGDVVKSRQRGGWFFLNGWDSIEIWYQMHHYLTQYLSGN